MVSKGSDSPATPPQPSLCRKDPEANTKPLNQMPVEFAREPAPAASAAVEKTQSYTASNVGSLRVHQTVRTNLTTEEEAPAQKSATKDGIAAIRPLGNQYV